MYLLKRETTAKRGLGSRYVSATCLLLCSLFLLAAGAGPAEAQLLPPVLTVTFTPAQVVVGGTTTLTVTVTNPNQTPVEGILDNITFSNSYPPGLVPDEAIVSNSAGGTCGSEAATSGFNLPSFTPTGFSLAEAEEIPAGQSCNVVVLMHATSAGSLVDTTSTIISGDAPDGVAASATLTSTYPVPSLGNWGLIGFFLLLGAASYRAARRRSA